MDVWLSFRSLKWFSRLEGCSNIRFTASSQGVIATFRDCREGWVLSYFPWPFSVRVVRKGNYVSPLRRLSITAGSLHAVLITPTSCFPPIARCEVTAALRSLSAGCRWTFIHSCKISIVETSVKPERESKILIPRQLKARFSLTPESPWSCLGCIAIIFLPEAASLL